MLQAVLEYLWLERELVVVETRGEEGGAGLQCREQQQLTLAQTISQLETDLCGEAGLLAVSRLEEEQVGQEKVCRCTGVLSRPGLRGRRPSCRRAWPGWSLSTPGGTTCLTASYPLGQSLQNGN